LPRQESHLLAICVPVRTEKSLSHITAYHITAYLAISARHSSLSRTPERRRCKRQTRSVWVCNSSVGSIEGSAVSYQTTTSSTLTELGFKGL
jgi:hypothetical protein